MSTTTRSQAVQRFLVTMLLGSVMAAAIWVLAEPGSGWIGFAMAAILRARPHARCLLPGVVSRTGR